MYNYKKCIKVFEICNVVKIDIKTVGRFYSEMQRKKYLRGLKFYTLVF